MKTVTAYRCEFHPRAKILATERAMKRHESTCIHNPANRTCATCEHDYSEPGDPEFGDMGSAGCSEGARDPDVRLHRECTLWEAKSS